MGFFTKAVAEALLTGVYKCSECGSRMILEDDNESQLVCPECGHSIDLELYGHEEDYETLYPTKEEFLGMKDGEEDDGETYEQVYGELDDD